MVDEFVNLEYNKITRDEIAQRIIDYYKSAFEAGKSTITDFNEGSNARNIVEAVSIPLYELRYLADHLLKMAYPQRAINGFLDEIGIIVNCYRDTAKKSNGYVTIITEDIKSYNIPIDAGTIIETEGPNPIVVQTTEKAVLQAGT